MRYFAVPTAPITTHALCPPKPKLLEMARRTRAARAVVRHVVEVAVRVGRFVVDRRMHDAVAECVSAEAISSTPPRRAQQVADHALGAADGELARRVRRRPS